MKTSGKIAKPRKNRGPKKFVTGFSIREILDITEGRPFFGEGSRLAVCRARAKGVSTDSRTIRRGELFIALNGENFNGAKFIGQAIRRGALAVIMSETDSLPAAKLRRQVPLIVVKEARRALSAICKAHRDRFDIPIIAITGSNGKTTTKDMIAHMLGKRFKVLSTTGTENNKVGAAQLLLRLKDQDFVVIEVGTNSCGEIRYHSAILRPDMAIVTNIGPSHLEGLKSLEGVLKEKIALVESLGPKGVWVKNCDDKILAGKSYKGLKVISYGIDKEKVDFKASDIRQTEDGIEFSVKVSLLPGLPARKTAGSQAIKRAKPRVLRFRVPVFGKHNVYNMLAAIAACSPYMGVKAMQKALADFKAEEQRMEVLSGRGFTVINDCYNSNPLSFECAVRALKDYPAPGKRIVVAGDMLELGQTSDRLHYDSGRLLASEKIDMLLTFGGRAGSIAKGALEKGMSREAVTVFKKKQGIAPFLSRVISKGDVVLIKGSRGMKMEEVTDCFINCSIR
ncbi:MAG: UDP-N-acetylmuramoyl-tripeptide--D-alanyl-D-alanine ligase [Candidatus Omnitrophica bacterium]|nr:UDP-N-acetylmuramoyl-tripeptide--D-alanyl-D-alanine ligase [Candidatus Omnitrophota bacterium]